MTDPDELPAFPFDPESIVASLEEHQVDYILVGGSAVIAYGLKGRETFDLDLVPKETDRNLARLGDALRQLDARVVTHWDAEIGELHVDESTFEPAIFRDNPYLHLLTSLGRIDVLLRVPGASGGYDHLVQRAVYGRMGERDVPLASVEDLIRMKEAVGREKDQVDVAGLRALL